MQSISVFRDMTKNVDFQGKNADVSRTQKVCHVIIHFLDHVQIKYKCAKCHHCRKCVIGFEEGRFKFL